MSFVLEDQMILISNMKRHLVANFFSYGRWSKRGLTFQTSEISISYTKCAPRPYIHTIMHMKRMHILCYYYYCSVEFRYNVYLAGLQKFSM